MTLHKLEPSYADFKANTPEAFEPILQRLMELETKDIPQNEIEQLKQDGGFQDDNEVLFTLTIDKYYIELMKKFRNDQELKVDYA